MSDPDIQDCETKFPLCRSLDHPQVPCDWPVCRTPKLPAKKEERRR